MEVKVAILQLNSKLDFKENLLSIQRLISEACELGIKYLFLPECFYSMSDGTKPTPHLVTFANEHFKHIQKLASDNHVFLLGGSVAFLEDDKVLNRSLNFDDQGRLLGYYDKMHLFACDLKEGNRANTITESDIYTPGKTPKLIQAGPLKIGLSICFDLRYPDMFRQYVLDGAQILSVSAAFTVPTGKAHWHTLLRARAIENQCFVLAPAQYGRHNEKIETFGHSLIIGPWGDVLADGGEGEKLVWATLDLAQIKAVRSAVKVF
ncbi:MAG: hypothetical protein A2X86_07320 [Bdellovibrionales bacterium GWA2_49_15]|nr:MAG: hypothetical protein A2X86_07320 [Bdellovibrionales bacterium GWA2_49_15]HAZ11913.1 amidohydrolase [Bdellovibrionales bacterium]